MLYDQSLKRTRRSEPARWLASALGRSVLAALGACGSAGGGAAGAPCDPCDAAAATVTTLDGSVLHPDGRVEGGQGDEIAATMLAGHTTNPDGIPYPYPTVGYGRNSRSGMTAGSIMPNYRFLGYPNSDESMGLQTVALADYYDPCMKRYKLLHITVAGVWCDPCNEETSALVAGATQLAAEGAVVFQVLDDGTVMGTPATQADLNYWITSHRTTFSEALDPMLTNLGSLVDAASIPWNCDIDPRTMEILDQSNGWTGDITTELAPGFQALPATPSYPPPVACN